MYMNTYVFQMEGQTMVPKPLKLSTWIHHKDHKGMQARSILFDKTVLTNGMDHGPLSNPSLLVRWVSQSRYPAVGTGAC